MRTYLTHFGRPIKPKPVNAAFSPGALVFVSLAGEPAAEFRAVGTADFRGFDERLAGFSSPQGGDSTTSVQTMSPAN
jgi:hypothetical protein